MSEQCILVDSFRGSMSSFADEDVYSVFRSRQSAMREVVRRFKLLVSESPDQFDDCSENDISHKLLTVVFSDWEKANAWIESQIESQVQTFGLERESAVDGRFVTIDPSGHTIEYDAKARVIK